MAEDLSTPATGDLALDGPAPDGPAPQGLVQAAALAHVPGFSHSRAHITPLAGGGFNRSYLVRTPAGRFVVRFSPEPDAWLATDRSAERILHGAAAAAGLAPPIVHADPADRWLITEFVEGTPWGDASFARRECLAKLGDTLCALHALAPPAVGRFDLLQALGHYAQRLQLAGAGAPAGFPAGDYLEQAAVAWELSGASDRPVAVLHHDLHGSNLIESPSGRLVLIDWECAVVNDPLLDVACALSYFPSARAHADVLLERSGLAHVTERQLAASVWLFDLHMWLWYRERGTRREPTPAELAAEAQRGRALAGGIPSAL
jgi:aminoglycoside phosphotransferase (APT) family kinase protein